VSAPARWTISRYPYGVSRTDDTPGIFRFIDDLAQQIVLGPGEKFHLGYKLGFTQCTRLRRSGAPKRGERGGGTSSGIFETASGCSRRHSRSSSTWLMPVYMVLRARAA